MNNANLLLHIGSSQNFNYRFYYQSTLEIAVTYMVSSSLTIADSQLVYKGVLQVCYFDTFWTFHLIKERDVSCSGHI